MRGHLRGTLLVFMAIGALFAAFAAQASAGYVEAGEFAGNGSGPGGSGSEPGQLSNPGQAAVLDSSGQLFVADTGNNRVELFNPGSTGGSYAGEVPVTSPTGVAIDQTSGDFYVAGPTGVSKFDSSFSPVAGWTDPGVTGPLAVDPTDGDLLVADTAANLIRRFEPDGTAAATFAAERPVDLAVTNSGEVLVVTSTGPMPGECGATSAVERFSSTGTPEGTIGASLSAPGAVAVDPDDGTIAIASVVNEYFCNGSDNPKVSFFSSAGTLNEAVTLTGNAHYASVPGLAFAGGGSDRAYAITKSPGNDSFGNTKVVAMEDKEAAPTVLGTSIKSVYEDSARVRAELNPEGLVGKYHFEYGTADCAVSACASFPVPAAEFAAGIAAKTVGVTLAGLQPDTTYHFRIVASNAFGTSKGPDTTFHTQAPAFGPPLPENRAWEMVTPPDKGDYDVTYGTGFVGSYTVSSDDGNKVGFNSFGSFADPQGAPIVNQYMTERSPSGWTSRQLSRLQAPGFPNFERFFGLSEDMSRGFAANNFGETPHVQEGLYLTNTATGSVERIAPPSGTGTPHLAEATLFVTGTPSWNRIAFENILALSPESPGRSVYGFTAGGSLSVLSILPDGEPAVEPRLGNGKGGGSFEINSRAMSTDGSRVYFQGIDPAVSEAANLYLRQNGSTIMVSASQRSVPDPNILPAQFEGASKDGSVVYFSSGTKLTDDSVASDVNDADLYRYDVSTGKLTDLTTADPAGGGLEGNLNRVWAVSPDGTLVYFNTHANLTPGATGTGPKFYVYDATDGVTRLIAPISLAGEFPHPFFTQPMLSKNGRQIAFITAGKIGSYENASFGELYRWDEETDELVCVSCNPSGAQPTGGVEGTPPIFGPYVQRETRQARIISADGSMLAFTTRDALVAADTNEVNDTYFWRNGQVHLISGGLGQADSNLMDMSADGRNVFFITRDRLVGIDKDNAYDIYDARVDGGIAAQNPGVVTPCTGTDCQGVPTSAPSGASILTDGQPQKACGNQPRKAKQLTTKAKKLRAQAKKARKGKAAKLRKQAVQAEKKARQARACKGGAR